MSRLLTLLFAAILGGAVAMPAAAQGSHGQGLQLTAQLGQLNGSGASGTATVSVRGSVQVPLTTTGDASANSALAVARFPVADADGSLFYSRTFQLPAGVTPTDMRNGVIVQHGISELFEDPTQYDGEPRSSFTSALPLEATIPTDCGKLMGPGN